MVVTLSRAMVLTEMKQEDCKKRMEPSISRRQAVSRLLQVVAGTVGVASIAGCPGGSTYGRAKLGAEHGVEDVPQVGNLAANGNLVFNAANIPANTVMELMVGDTKAYLFHGQVDGETAWYATSRVCTHMAA